MQANNFEVVPVPANATDRPNVFSLGVGQREYELRIYNNNDRRALAKVFVNGVLIDSELVADKNTIRVVNPKLVAGKVRVELYLQDRQQQPDLKGGFNIDIDIFGPHHHHHPYYPYPYYPYYPPPAPYYPVPVPVPYPVPPQPQPQPQHPHSQGPPTAMLQFENVMTVIEFEVEGV